MTRPLLLIDIDGVLNPAASRKAVDKRRLAHRYRMHQMMGFRVFLSPEHGPMLLDFAARHDVELVWATTWEHDANRLVGPAVGLPELPVIEFGWHGDRWKFGPVLRYAAGRPLAWLDDDFRFHAEEQAWFEAERGDAPTLLHLVPAVHGLQVEDLDAVAEWLATSVEAPVARSGEPS